MSKYPYRLYKVGGCVRDKLLGLESKDIDFAVEAPSFDALKKWVESVGEVFPIPNADANYTVRGRVKELGGAVDFVLCRKEGPYSDGRRPDWVLPGTLMDDLKRRDFTMNAIAVDEEGQMIDPFNGREHIKARLITCVGNARDRLREDSLRMLRALRFCITKNFNIAPDVEECLDDGEYLKLLSNVSEQRQVEELMKMFRADTKKAVHLLFEVYPGVGYTLFDQQKIWLKPTLEKA